MANKPSLDIEALLAPIPGDNPAGASLRYAGDYDEIKNLLPKPDRDAFEASGQEGQWPKLVQLASQKIRDKSKDLNVAAWLTEGLVHQHGFAGLRDGLTLIHGLCDRFWDGVYPLPDDGDLEVRAAPLQSLFERNAGPWVFEISLTRAPIKAPDTDEKIPVTYNLWHSIVVAQLEDKKPLQGAMEQAAADSPTEFLLQLHGNIKETEEALLSLKQLMAERFGPAAPGVVSVAEALAKCKSRIVTVLAKRGVSVDQADGNGETAAATEEGAAAAGANGMSSGPIRSRDAALDRLREVADFFRRTEPHSPVPYLITRAINWSRMSFDQLLVELVKDENSRSEINSTLGIRSGEAGHGNGQEGTNEP
jgi:type VI secretion system ImpA family protein